MNSLTIKAAALARMAPTQWSDFLAALTAYVDERKDECIRSPIDVLPVTQGRAQQASIFLTLLSNAVKDADRQDRKAV